MSHLSPKAREELPELEPLFAGVEASMGFVPSSMLTMAHWPELLASFSALGATILGPGEVDAGLKQLVAFVVSNASGCRYCQAHTSHVAERRGVSDEKIAAAFQFETSDLFTDAERAALRVAAHAGMVPNAVSGEQMVELGKHFSPRQSVEIVGVISLFGYLNRWNDTMATTLEDHPRAFAEQQLAGNGWDIGKHGG